MECVCRRDPTWVASFGHGTWGMRGDLDKLSTPERLERMLVMSELRRTHLVERIQAIKALHAKLTPEQQRVFDAAAISSPHRHRHHHPRHHSWTTVGQGSAGR